MTVLMCASIDCCCCSKRDGVLSIDCCSWEDGGVLDSCDKPVSIGSVVWEEGTDWE